MADRFRDRVSFLVVYIHEAHPEDGWVLPENRRSGVAIHNPVSDGERRAVAATCAARLELRMPMVVDHVDNAVGSAYGGWPNIEDGSARTASSYSAGSTSRATNDISA